MQHTGSFTDDAGIEWVMLPTGLPSSAWEDVAVYCTEVQPGSYSYTIDIEEHRVWAFFKGTPESYEDAQFVLDYSSEWIAQTLINRTQGGVSYVAPVSLTGQLKELIIGDDYLDANGRALVWTVPPVQGFDIDDCIARLGLAGASSEVVVEGSVTEVDSESWRLSFDVTKSNTEALKEGLYRWSVAVHCNGVEITRVKHKEGCYVSLVSKQA